MNSTKRIAIASAAGLAAGFCCIAGAKIIFALTFTPLMVIYILSSRMLIGFVIGISSLKMPWPVHGLLIGFIIGFPFPLYDLIIGQGSTVAGAAFIMNLVFGVSIEFVTTVIFKAPAEK